MTIRRVFTGKNVQEATAVALETLDAELEDVDIRVINPGRAGIFGLGGALAEIEVAKLSDVLAEEAQEAQERQRQMDQATGVADETQSRPARQPRQTHARQQRQTQRQRRPQRDDPRDESEEDAAPQQRRQRQRPQPRRNNRRTAQNRQRTERGKNRATRQPRQPRQQNQQVQQSSVEDQTAQFAENDQSAPVQQERTRQRRPEPVHEPIQDREELETVTSEILAYLISSMKVDVDAYVLDELRDGSVVFEIEGSDAGLLIGRRGETLRDVQFIVRMLVNRRVEQRANVIIDVERYQLRRTQKLHAIAENAARTASRGRAKSLDPMTPEERRIVHMALSDNPSVVTESEGQGPDRHVVVKPS